jgi:predicted nicotinamide N-methyase
MTITRKIHDLKRDLSNRYLLTEERHNLHGRTLSITCVEDAEALFSRLLTADPKSLDVLDERLPYWATLWGSALVLANELLGNSHIQPGEAALELGCGLGLVSAIACLKRARVTTTDYQPDALKFARLNCLQIAGTDPETLILDWREPPRDRQYPLLLGADLVYETRFFDPLITTFDTLLAPNGRVLFSEPNRELGKPFFDRLPDAGWAFTLLVEKEAGSVYEIRRHNEQSSIVNKQSSMIKTTKPKAFNQDSQ